MDKFIEREKLVKAKAPEFEELGYTIAFHRTRSTIGLWTVQCNNAATDNNLDDWAINNVHHTFWDNILPMMEDAGLGKCPRVLFFINKTCPKIVLYTPFCFVLNDMQRAPKGNWYSVSGSGQGTKFVSEDVNVEEMIEYLTDKNLLRQI